MSLARYIAALTLSALVGCSTTQEITLAKNSAVKPIKTIAQVADDGNSSQMDTLLAGALQKEGLVVRAPLPKGTRTSPDVDALVSYVDVWRWDIVMYMKNLTIRLHDAPTGDLLAIGQWTESPMHGFRDAKVVMEGLVADLLSKLRGSTSSAATK